MTKILLMLVLVFIVAAAWPLAIAQERPAGSPHADGSATAPATAPVTRPGEDGAGGPTRFTFVDLVIDPKGETLGAWQVEFAAEVGKVSLVGIEQGEHPAYAARAPYYDAAALAGNRVIVGDYSLEKQLPKNKTRVARLMLEVRGQARPQYVAKVMAAANGGGKRIAVNVAVEEKD